MRQRPETGSGNRPPMHCVHLLTSPGKGEGRGGEGRGRPAKHGWATSTQGGAARLPASMLRVPYSLAYRRTARTAPGLQRKGRGGNRSRQPPGRDPAAPARPALGCTDRQQACRRSTDRCCPPLCLLTHRRGGTRRPARPSAGCRRCTRRSGWCSFCNSHLGTGRRCRLQWHNSLPTAGGGVRQGRGYGRHLQGAAGYAARKARTGERAAAQPSSKTHRLQPPPASPVAPPMPKRGLHSRQKDVSSLSQWMHRSP